MTSAVETSAVVLSGFTKMLILTPLQIPCVHVCLVEVSLVRCAGRQEGFVRQACKVCFAALCCLAVFLQAKSQLFALFQCRCIVLKKQKQKQKMLNGLLFLNKPTNHLFSLSFSLIESVECHASSPPLSLPFLSLWLVFSNLLPKLQTVCLLRSCEDQRVSDCIADLQTSTYLRDDGISLPLGKHHGTSQAALGNPHFPLTCAAPHH